MVRSVFFAEMERQHVPGCCPSSAGRCCSERVRYLRLPAHAASVHASPVWPTGCKNAGSVCLDAAAKDTTNPSGCAIQETRLNPISA